MRSSAFLVAILFVPALLAEEQSAEQLAAYFAEQTDKVSAGSLSQFESREDWERQRPRLREELLEMLGLSPLPSRTPLEAEVTGITQRDGIIAENIHFQSRPGLYVTANLYRPEHVEEKLPAILYVCGHARVKENGISYGNKIAYRHHGAWFARNGYVCLTIDTIQLGELEGLHHGTYREKMWWWLNRGYTPAGVEAWNSIRAIDYLISREEVDAARIGMTGRSGGGAYSWWTAAIDERVQVVVPVAGITDLQNHVVDGTVEGHCDCMFMVNTYRWDYDMVAAMIAPRPLLISNTDSDSIFPLNGVYRTFTQVRRIYQLYDASRDVALHITAGPHKDTQELRIHAFRWFNHYLKQDDDLIRDAADKVFTTEELRVFDKLPDDEITTSVHETFVAVAGMLAVPQDLNALERARETALPLLMSRVFAGWPSTPSPLQWQLKNETTHRELQIKSYDFESQPHVPLQLVLAHRGELAKISSVRIILQGEKPAREDESSSIPTLPQRLAAEMEEAETGTAVAFFWPRGSGPLGWDVDERKWTQIRRRFYLLGQSLDGMRIYDLRRAIEGLRTMPGGDTRDILIEGEGRLGCLGLFASLFDSVQQVTVRQPPQSDKHDPYLLNVRRFLDLPQVVAMAALRSRVRLLEVENMRRWGFAVAALEASGLRNQLDIEAAEGEPRHSTTETKDH